MKKAALPPSSGLLIRKAIKKAVGADKLQPENLVDIDPKLVLAIEQETGELSSVLGNNLLLLIQTQLALDRGTLMALALMRDSFGIDGIEVSPENTYLNSNLLTIASQLCLVNQLPITAAQKKLISESLIPFMLEKVVKTMPTSGVPPFGRSLSASNTATQLKEKSAGHVTKKK